MNPVEQELLTLAQVDVEHQQHLRWDDLRRAVVLHLDELPHEPFRIEQRVYKNEICPDLLENKPCTQWKTGTAATPSGIQNSCKSLWTAGHNGFGYHGDSYAVHIRGHWAHAPTGTHVPTPTVQGHMPAAGSLPNCLASDGMSNMLMPLACAWGTPWMAI